MQTLLLHITAIRVWMTFLGRTGVDTSNTNLVGTKCRSVTMISTTLAAGFHANFNNKLQQRYALSHLYRNVRDQEVWLRNVVDWELHLTVRCRNLVQTSMQVSTLI